MIERATGVGPSKIDIAYERLGDPSAPPVLLIMGLGAQLIGWPDGLCDELLARGLHVIRFDNRDAGESTHFTGTPNMMAAMAGDRSQASYTLTDMAADTAGLLDVLGIASTHVVGASMGGFIAQTLAIEHPRRVRSLTSIMSSTGSLAVGQAQPHVWAMLASSPAPPTNREEAAQLAIKAFSVIGSPGFPRDDAAIGDRAARAYDRGFDLAARARQGVAVIASGDRTARLRTLDVPTLVIHGAADPLVDVSGGRATAEAIPGAELLVIEGMGHDLPRPLWPQLATKIAETVRRGESR